MAFAPLVSSGVSLPPTRSVFGKMIMYQFTENKHVLDGTGGTEPLKFIRKGLHYWPFSFNSTFLCDLNSTVSV